jgi:CHASE2 domain-containing sensor protein
MSLSIVPKKRVWLGRISLTGVYFALCAAFLLWALDETQFPRSVDNLFYDVCLRTVSRSVDVPAHVLLIDGPFTDKQSSERQIESDRLLVESVAKLSRLDARAIGISFPVSSELAEEIRAIHRQVVFVSSSDHELGDTTYPLASGAILRPMNGVYRDHYVQLGIHKPRSLEAAMAALMVIDTSHLPRQFYRIFFRGGAHSLPHTTTETLQNDHLTADLVAGKAVLIGLRATTNDARWSVPTTNGKVGMTPLEIRGHALNTLLVDRSIQRFPRWFTLLISMAAAFLGQCVFRRVNVRMAAATFVAMIAAVLGCAWLLLAWLHLWIPCVPLAAILTFCFAVAAEMRLVAAGTALRLLRIRREKKSVSNQPHDALSVEEDPWTDLVDLTFQMFYLRRLIILELPVGRDHLVPVKFVSCGPEDIQERRRDYRRSPYTDSLRNGPARPNKSRPFFVKDDPQDVEFLVPLTFGGKGVGFLAVSLYESVLEESPEFNKELDRLAKEIALLIAQHRSRRQQRLSMRGIAGKLLQRVPEDELFEEIEDANHLKMRRDALLDDVFQSSEIASAIYDAFGQLVTMNKAMFRALQNKGALPAQLTALESMAFLTHHETTECRNKIRRAIIDGRQQAILIESEGDASTKVLHVRPVSSAGVTSAVDPFEVQGIHYELVDTSILHQIQGVKKRLADNVFGKLEMELMQLKRSIAELNAEEMSSDRFHSLRHKMAQELSSSISNVAAYKSYLGKKASNDADEFMPVDACGVLRNAVRTVKPTAASREIDIAVDLPSGEYDVLANPHLLRVAFELTLKWLTQKARDESEIKIECDDAVTQLVIRYQNQAAGTSTERLQECLAGESTDADEFRQLRELQAWFARWDSRLSIHSNADDGLVVEMFLKRHQWSEHGDSGNGKLTKPHEEADTGHDEGIGR